MREGKSKRHHGEGKPAEATERNRLKFFRNQEAKQKAAPENFLNQWDDNDQSNEPEREREPIDQRIGSENFGIKSGTPGGKVNKLLRGDPKKKGQQSNSESKK